MMPRKRPLALLYAELNRTFFGGRLDRVPVRRVRSWREFGWSRPRLSPRSRAAYVQAALSEPLGICLTSRSGAIHVDSGLSPEAERKTLLHEMCHLATREEEFEGHGPRFIAELRRLAALDESWAIEEAERYARALGVPVAELLE